MIGLTDIAQLVTEVHVMVKGRQANNQFAKLLYQRLAETVLPLKQTLPKDHPANRELQHLYEIATEIRDYIDKYNEKGGFKTFFFAGKYSSEFERLNGNLVHAKADLAVALSLPFTRDGNAEADEDHVAGNAMQNYLYQSLQENNIMVKEFLDLPDDDKKIFLESFQDFRSMHSGQKKSVLTEIRRSGEIYKAKEIPVAGVRRLISHALNSFEAEDHWIPSDQLSATSEWESLGRGSFGTVYRGALTRTPVAIKVLDASVSDGTGQERDDFLREMKILQRLKECKYTVFFVGCTEVWLDGKKRDAIIMQYCANGSLADRVYTTDFRSMMTIPDRIDALCQIAAGMVYLTSKGVVHRDLKSHNILVTAENVMKIADFGLSATRTSVARASGRRFEAAGTMPWMAPEIINATRSGNVDPRQIYGESSDVYSFGVLCYEVMTGEQPFRNYNESGMRECILSGNHPNVNPEEDGSPAPMQKLIAFCCSRDVSRRPMFVQVQRLLERIKNGEDPFTDPLAPPSTKPSARPRSPPADSGSAVPAFRYISLDVEREALERARGSAAIPSSSNAAEAQFGSEGRPESTRFVPSAEQGEADMSNCSPNPASSPEHAVQEAQSNWRDEEADECWIKTVGEEIATCPFATLLSSLQRHKFVHDALPEVAAQTLRKELLRTSYSVSIQNWRNFVRENSRSTMRGSAVLDAVERACFPEAVEAWEQDLRLGNNAVHVEDFKNALLWFVANKYFVIQNARDFLETANGYFLDQYVSRSDWIRFVIVQGNGSISSALGVFSTQAGAKRGALPDHAPSAAGGKEFTREHAKPASSSYRNSIAIVPVSNHSGASREEHGVGGDGQTESERLRATTGNHPASPGKQQAKAHTRQKRASSAPSAEIKGRGFYILNFKSSNSYGRGVVKLARQATEEWKSAVSTIAEKVGNWHKNVVVVSALQDAMKDIDRAWFFPEEFGGCATGSIAESEKRWEELQKSSGKSRKLYKDLPLTLSSGVTIFAPRVQIASITAAQRHLKNSDLRILDVGCKFGFTTALLARAARPPDGKVECIGIDHDDEHVRLATAAINWACPELVSRVRFLKKDDYILNDSKGFDIIHSSVVILEENLGDFLGMLKPHGELVGLVQRDGELRLEKHARLSDGFKTDIIAEAQNLQF